jgi:hypothetical protein
LRERPGAQLAAERTEPLGQHALDERVDVLVGIARRHRAGAKRIGDRAQLADDRRKLGIVENPRPLQFACMRLRRYDVVRRQPEVSRLRTRQPHQRRVGR